jgi:hypothetical protein
MKIISKNISNHLTIKCSQILLYTKLKFIINSIHKQHLDTILCSHSLATLDCRPLRGRTGLRPGQLSSVPSHYAFIKNLVTIICSQSRYSRQQAAARPHGPKARPFSRGLYQNLADSLAKAKPTAYHSTAGRCAALWPGPSSKNLVTILYSLSLLFYHKKNHTMEEATRANTTITFSSGTIKDLGNV